MTAAKVRGTRIALAGLDGAAAEVTRWIDEGARSFVCLANVHLVETAHRTPRVAESLGRAGMILPDGAPVAWAAGRRVGHAVSRVTGSDLFEELCRRSPGHYRHFFYGSTSGTLARLEETVRRRYPGIVVCGRLAPPFRPLSEAEDAAVVSQINSARPDIVWVGLGAPKQELWMSWARDRLDAPALIGVGAVFDFASGTRRRAPTALRRFGLEWAFRLVLEPRRLGGRYLVTNSSFLAGIGRELIPPQGKTSANGS
jgi:N-acetylglucosaminyldiphosphoundecaprenol N-acetyl-beta-D-mannosaminyltransferase